MAGRNQALRERWFKEGVKALQLARPGAPRCYACPLCVQGFSNVGALSLEDVPPKSVGGRPLVLTCTTCNNTAGTMLDAHIRSGRDLHEIAAGTRDIPVRLTQFGQTVSARATFGPGKIAVHGLPQQSDPKAHQAWVEGLGEAARSGSTDWTIKLGFSIRHRESHEGVGWLRVAYLYTFAALGYNWMMRPCLEPIREQIRRPGETIARQVMKHVDKDPKSDGISLVHQPEELRSVLVRLGRNLFFFPEFEKAGDFYERLENAKGTGQTLHLSGTHIDLPRGPSFAFDHQPALMRLTLPPEERTGGD